MIFLHDCDTMSLASDGARAHLPQKDAVEFFFFFFSESLGRFLKVAEFNVSTDTLGICCAYFSNIN